LSVPAHPNDTLGDGHLHIVALGQFEDGFTGPDTFGDHLHTVNDRIDLFALAKTNADLPVAGAF
jgi:hypothetical protein